MNLNDYVILSQINFNIDINKFDINDIKNICFEKNIFCHRYIFILKAKKMICFYFQKKYMNYLLKQAVFLKKNIIIIKEI